MPRTRIPDRDLRRSGGARRAQTPRARKFASAGLMKGLKGSGLGHKLGQPEANVPYRIR